MLRNGRNARRWYWLPDFILPGAQAALETIPLQAFTLTFEVYGQRGLSLSYPLLAGLVATGAWLTRATALLPQRFGIGRVILGCLSSICLIVWLRVTLAPDAAWSLRTAFLLISMPEQVNPDLNGPLVTLAGFLAICLWCRGLWIGFETLTVQREARWFVGGMATLLCLIAALAVAPMTEWAAIANDLRNLVLAYVFLGLGLLALAHVKELDRLGGAGAGAALLALLLPISFVPLLGLLFTLGAKPLMRETVHLATQIGLLTWHVVQWIGYLVLLFLLWLSHLSASGSGGRTRAQADPLPLPPPAHMHTSQEVGLSGFDPTIALLVLLGSLVALTVYLLTGGHQPADVVQLEEERSSLWSWGFFFTQLREIWRRLPDRLRTRPRNWPASRGASSRGPEETPKDIRQLYRRLLRHAALLGYARAPATTPLEFAHRLANAMPRHASGIHFLTSLYDQARYGEARIDPASFGEARDIADRIEMARTPDSVSTPSRRGLKPTPRGPFRAGLE
jgi:Domain of unknown function (DUF4129)